MPHVTYFSGGKADAFPASALDVPDLLKFFYAHAGGAPGHDKGSKGFVCFVRMKPGTDITVAELNLARAREDKAPLNSVQENTVRTLGYRNYAHVAEVTAIGIDYDEYPEIPPNWDPEVWPCSIFAHSTHNYDPEVRPGKWRVVLPLKTPCPIGKEPALRKVLASILPHGCMVRAPHQPAFLPTCPEDRTVEVVTVRQTEIPEELDWTVLVDAEDSAAETVHASGEAAGTLIGAEFNSRGLVRRDLGSKLDVVCPWADEHKSGGDLGFVYYTEDGAGKFGCAHGACKGRGTAEAYAYFDGTPNEAVAPEVIGGESDSEHLPPAEPPVWVTGAALASPVGPVNWLVESLELAPGRTPLLIADSGAGKSWSVQSLALSVASGQPVFGAFACRQGAVLHIAEDSDLEAVKDRYQRLARGMGLRLEDLDLAVYGRQFRVTDSRGNYDPERLEKLRQLARKNSAALVILDSLATICVGLDENGPEIALPLYGSRDSEVTFLWTHHTPKNGEVYRGSTAIRAAAGAMWHQSVNEDGTRGWENKKFAERTNGKRMESFKTTWEVDGDAARIVVLAEEGASRLEERPADRIQKEILKVMAEGRSTKTNILELVGGNKNLRLAVFEFLIQSRVIEHVGPRYILAAGVAPVRMPDHLVEGAYRKSNNARG